MKLLNLPAETVAEAESLFRLDWRVEAVAKQLNISPEKARRIRQALMARETPPGALTSVPRKKAP